MGNSFAVSLYFLFVLLFSGAISQSITNLEVISYVGPASLTTASSRVSFDFYVKNAPSDGSRFVVFEFPVGYLSKQPATAGTICTIDPANAFTCTSAAQDANAYCFFADNTDLASLSGINTCDGNANLLGTTAVAAPTAKTLVAVLSTRASFKLTIGFLIPPAYPSPVGATPVVAVYAAELNTGVTPVSNVVTQTLPAVALGEDFANVYKWYIRVLSGSNYVFTTSTITVGAGVMLLDAAVYPAAGSFALLSNLFSGDHITLVPPAVMLFKAPQCSVYYASKAEVEGITSGSPAQHTVAFTGEWTQLAIPLPMGLLARRTDANALRVLCSGLTFRMVPPAVTTMQATISTTSATSVQKSVLVPGTIANPLTSPISVEPMSMAVTLSGTATITDTASAVFTITFPTAPLSATTILTLIIPPNIGWTAATTCTLAVGSSSTATSVPVLFTQGTNVTIAISQTLMVTNKLTCLLTPPYYAQNDVTGVDISLAHAVWVPGVGYPAIARGTFTWVAAKAGTWAQAVLSLTNKYVGDPPGDATVLLRVPTLRSSPTDVYVFTVPRVISVNVNAPSLCTLTTNAGAVTATAALTPSLSPTTDHTLTFKLNSSINAGVTYVRATCTNFQSPAVIVGALTAHAQLTNAQGRVIMEKTMSVSAGVTPDFGSNEAFVAALPPETGVVTDVVITLRPVVEGLMYNWNLLVPTLWTVPSGALVPSCKATYRTNQYTLPYAKAGQNFRLDTTNLRLAVTTLDAVVITCPNFTTPYITTAAEGRALSFLNDQWVSPSNPPVAPLVQWPAITPGITPYKSVTLAHAVVNTVTDATFTFLNAHTKSYALYGVLTLTFPKGWALSATETRYTYAQDAQGQWVESAEPVGGLTVCSMYQASNSLPITNTVFTVTAAGEHAVALTIGSSSQADQGDVTVHCTNVKTYRGAVDTQVVRYRYVDASAVVTEETTIRLPTLKPAALGWAEATLSHSDLHPARIGTLSLTLRGVTNSLRQGEAVCVVLPTDFTMHTAAAATASHSATYTDLDVARFARRSNPALAHAALAAGTGALSTSSLAALVYHVEGADVTSACSLQRDGIPLPITAYATRNTTTDTTTGDSTVETSVCVSLTSASSADWLLRGAALYTLQCTGTTTSPYAHPARADVRLFTRTEDMFVLDETRTATFPEVLPGALGAAMRTLVHSPGRAGRSGTLTLEMATLTNAVTTGQTINALLPPNWTEAAGGCSASIVAAGASMTSTCVVSVVDGKAQMTLTVTGTVPSLTPLSIAVSGITAPPYAEDTQAVTVWTATRKGYTVDKTDDAQLAGIAPGELGSGVAAVLLSNFADAAVSEATFLMYPLPNGLPAGGYLAVTLPSSPAFPALLDNAACSLQYYYDPLLKTTTATGETITGAAVYDKGTTVAGTTSWDAATMQLRFSPSVPVPNDRIAHLYCKYLRNPNKQAYHGVRFPVRSYTAAGKLVDATERMAIDSGYPASLAFSTQPPVAALVSKPFAVAPTLAGVDYFGNPATGGAYVYLVLKRNDNDANAALHGNTTQNMVAGVARFPGLSVDTVGYAYQLTAGCYGAALVHSDPFSVWEGAEATKFFWSVFPYLQVVNQPFSATAYVRKVSSVDVDDTASVPVIITLHDAATRADVSHLLQVNGVSGPIAVTTVAGLAPLEVRVDTVGEYYLSVFSTVGYFLAGETPRFRVMAKAAQTDDVLLAEDDVTVRVAITLFGTEGLDEAELTTLQAEWNTYMCESVQLYFPAADAEALCARLRTVSVTSEQWTIDVLPTTVRGARPNSFEVAEVLRQLILDVSSVWHATPGGPYTVDVQTAAVTTESDPWISLGVVSGSLGAGVAGIGGAILYRMRAVVA